MNIAILGAAGFIGTNLAIKLADNQSDSITLVDQCEKYFDEIKKIGLKNVKYSEFNFSERSDFDAILMNQDIVFHLVSTTVPTTSNQQIAEELSVNVVSTAKMLDACVRNNVKKIVFISSGGTVYGKEANCPLKEDTPTNPISSYGIQKITIEKLIYLYNYLYGIDYRIVRLANPYGPYQKPNGVLGAVTTFTYKALKNEKIIVYGDGTVVRDFIYIDDAIRALIKITWGNDTHRTFNLGCGYGSSINNVLEQIESTLGIRVNVEYIEGRKVDVPVNYLDISRYENAYGLLKPISLSEGIWKTAEFMKQQYGIE